MKDMMGVINLYEGSKPLQELTRYRSTAAVPFGSSYRIIDFIMSNMVNSGIENISVTALGGYRSVINHIGTASDWGLDNPPGGLFILPPADGSQAVEGDLQIFQDNLDYFHRSEQDYVLICGDNVVCNINYQQALNFHRDMEADITVLYSHDFQPTRDSFPVTVEISENGLVSKMCRREADGPSDVSLGMFIMRRSLLLDIISTCSSAGACDLLQDGIMANLSKLEVYAFEFPGYSAIIDSIASYYRHSMELLQSEVLAQLFNNQSPIYAKISNSPPSRYEKTAQVTNALASYGCKIAGTVENSVLFRRVKIHPDAKVTDSIIMQGTEIEEGARIENAIVDKNVVISRGKDIIGAPGCPVVVEKRSVI